jgi:hypothetical protein
MVPRPRFLLVILFLGISSCFVSAQNTGCSLPTAEISHVSRPTGVLRADPNANDTASQKIAADVARTCTNLSSPTAAQQVRLKISDNNIIVSGAVPTASDGQQLVDIAVANADGRTVFNRIEVVPLQMASRGRQ